MKRDEAIEAIRAVRHRISVERQHNTRLLIRHYQGMGKLYADTMLQSAVPAKGSVSRTGAELPTPE